MANYFKHCPSCGSKELKKTGTNGQKCLSCGKKHYHHDNPSIGALIVRNNKLLLGKRGIEPHKGEWDVPGGFIDPGEHPEEALIREVKEELNLEIKIIKLIGIYIDKYGNINEGTLNIHYYCKPDKGKIIPGSDLIDCHWFPLNKLPEIAFKNCQLAANDLVKLLNIKKNQ